MGEGLITRELDRARNALQGGRAKVSGRWHSAAWWGGHHLTPVDECGAFSDWEHAEECHNGGGGAGRRARKEWVTTAVARRRTERTPVAKAERDAFDKYLDERYNAAAAATNGVMLSKRGQARGYDSRRFFTRGNVDSGAASDELRDWFRDNGPVKTFDEHRVGARTGGATGSSIGAWWERDAPRDSGRRRGAMGLGWRS